MFSPTSKFLGSFMLISMSLPGLPNSLADDPNSISSASVMSVIERGVTSTETYMETAVLEISLSGFQQKFDDKEFIDCKSHKKLR